MKSMKQMQGALLSKAQWNGDWPRAVIVGLGVVALARNQAEYDALTRSNRLAWMIASVIGVVMFTSGLAWIAR